MSRSKTAFARQMRQNPTPAEKALWALLEARRTGVRWRRQAPMLGYIVDFYCPALRLVVEADGSSHIGRTAYDATRDRALRAHGLRVLRYPNAVILADPAAVVARIMRAKPPDSAPAVKERPNTAEYGSRVPVFVTRGSRDP